jgi:hypothetical protein
MLVKKQIHRLTHSRLSAFHGFTHCSNSQKLASFEFFHKKLALTEVGSTNLLGFLSDRSVTDSGTAFMSVASLGFAVNSNFNVTFNWNGSEVESILKGQQISFGSKTANLCWQLGFMEGATSVIRLGIMTCFVMSTRSLTVEEFKLLDDWCQQL